MWWDGSFGVFLAEGEAVAGHGRQAKDLFAAIQSKGCGLIGQDAGAPTDTFSNTAEFSTD
jgi:hypothetical protein